MGAIGVLPLAKKKHYLIYNIPDVGKKDCEKGVFYGRFWGLVLKNDNDNTIYFDFQRLMDKIVIGFGIFERFLVKIINVRNEHE